MKKRLLSLLLSLVMVMGLLPASALAAGTVRVASADELKAQLAANADIVLAGDLDLAGWTTHEAEFTGTLDGAGHSITGLKQPLLNTIGAKGMVTDLTITGAFIERKLADEAASNVGTLADTNAGTVKNVHLASSGLYGPRDGATGGLIGLNTGLVSQCSNQGGGTAQWSGIRKQQGDGTAGGVVGLNDGGHVDQCYNIDAVSSATGGHGMGSAGGVVGVNGNYGTVSHCYNRGGISNGTVNSGGIIGSNKDNDGREGICANSYHAGTVLGGNNNRVMTTYGYISNGHYLENDENAGHPDRKHPETPWRDEPQGLADQLNVVSDYFVIDGGKLKLAWETGKQPAAAEKADKTELNNTLMSASGLTQQSGPYTDASWLAFITAQENARFANAYPFTTVEQVTKVTAALNAAYSGLQKEEASKPDADLTWTEVGTADALKAALVAGGGIKLTADIALPSDWLTDDYKPFTLEGAGHTITLSGRSFIATTMFGTATESNLYKNCTIENVVFAGEVKGEELNGFGGAVAGTSEGLIRNCINLAAVAVSGMSNVGGLVGVNKGTIENCVGYGAVTGGNLNNGALAGKNNGTLTNSYGADQLATTEQRTAAVEKLNAALAEGDQKWKLADGKLAFDAGTEPENPDVPSVEVIEIGNQQQLEAAMYDAFEGNVGIHEGKKLVITADFTISGNFRMPKGLNTILDGQGHTITLNGALPLVDEIASKGEIRNLGLAGIVSSGEITGAFTNKSSGRIVNCWSTATVKNTGASTVGGFVGTLLETGAIENCYVAADLLKGKNVGALVGTVRPGSTITNSYWLTGAAENVYFRALDDLNFPVDYTGATGCSVKTDAELKSADFLALLNANKGENMQWNRSESGLPYFGENITPVEVIEIANQQQLEAAMYDAFEGNVGIHEGKKLVITADFTISGNFRMPKGLNTTLDGQGHTITLNGALPLVDEIASKGEIRNLGLAGIVSSGEITGAFTNKSSGRIVNCWSTATVKNTAAATVGGFVGTLLETGAIENCYVAADLLKGKNVGALVGTVRPGSTITNCYWKQGNGDKVYFRALDDMNMSVDYTGATACSVKTDAELKAPEFLALLNQNRGSNAEWKVGPNGYPHLGEASTVDPTQGIDVTLTFANGAEPVVFNTANGLNLTTLDILGMEIKLGTLSCENGAHWSIDYDTYGKDIMIGDSNGELYIYKPSTTKISVANSAWEKLATFTVTITESKAHALRMTASQGEMVNGVLTVPGRTTIHFVPEIQESEGGTWKAANPAMFEFNAPLENAEVVGSSVSPIKPGKFAVTVKGMGQTATQEVESTYAPITSIKPAPSGEFIIHGRQAMVFEKKADFLDLNLSHQTGTVLIEPAYATNQGKNAYNFSFSNPEVADYMADFVMGIRPLRAGTTDITVTTLLEEKNVSGTTQVTFKYKNPLTSIEYPAEVFEVKNGIKIDLPLVLHSELENEGWHVTEPEIDWTFESSDGGKVIIARDGQSVQSSLDSVEGGLWYASDHFTIEGISAGTVKVTGTPWDTTGGAKPFTFTVKVTGEGGPAVDYVQMAKDDTKIAGDWIIKNQNGVYGYNSEWEIFSLLRNGRTVAEAGIDAEAYLDNVAAAIQNPENAKIMKKPTEMARIILAVTVLGKDATDIRGIDLIDRITKSEDADMKVGSNESVWTLIALDTVDYKVPDGAKWTREALLDQILTFEVPTGGFGLFSNEKAGIDTTGMAIQALAPYYNTNAAVKAAVDKSVDYLRNAKDENCGYGNSESTAQVLTALAALRIDPLNASNGFTVGRKNLITNLDSYKTADGGFAHMTNAGSNGMAAYQTLYALEAFLRFHDYKAPLYDLSDIGSEGPVEPVDPAVDAVINKIAAIGKVTLQSEAAIKSARDAFNALNAEQQKLVTNLSVLAAAEKRLEELKNEGGGGITPPAEDITVTFRLIGAKKASEDVDFANGKTTASTGADYQNWIKTRSYTIPKDSTVYDVFTEALDRAGLAFKIRDKNNYVYSIQAPQALGGEMMEEFTNGYFSGWMYTLNGKHSSFGLSEQKLSDGDVVVWHYVNDFRYEVEDWFEGSSGDASTWIDVDSIPDTDPTEQSGGGSSIPTEKPEEDTRTETRPDGTVVETTTRTDGSSTVVETKKDGTVTTTDVTANGDKSVEVRKPDGSSTTNVEMKNGAVSTTTVDKDGRTEAQVKVPQKVFEQAARDNKPVVLPMPAVSAAQDQSKAPVIKLDAGKAENIMVKVPVANLTAGTVAVVVHADGTEEIIRKTASDKDGILVPLESGAVIKVVDNARKFDDAIPAWSREAVDFVTSRDLFNGTGASTFSPNASMSRAMLATVLWRLENEARSTAPASFQDVADGQWYTEAVNWAAEHRIVNGYGDNFAPNDSITRQQLATMMYRYADMLGLDMKADKDTTGFSDHDQVADWAADAMNWAVSVGLMNGKGNNQLDPAGTATRAEVAIMCQRMVSLMMK